jgi:hypothetical protein
LLGFPGVSLPLNPRLISVSPPGCLSDVGLTEPGHVVRPTAGTTGRIAKFGDWISAAVWLQFPGMFVNLRQLGFATRLAGSPSAVPFRRLN